MNPTEIKATDARDLCHRTKAKAVIILARRADGRWEGASWGRNIPGKGWNENCHKAGQIMDTCLSLVGEIANQYQPE